MAEQALKSPVSGLPMTRRSVQGVEVYLDEQTGGFWISLDAMRQLAEQQNTPLPEVYTGEVTQVHQGRFSPLTGDPLLEFEFKEHSGIRLDIDPKSGAIWLDGGELGKLLDYLESHEFSSHPLEHYPKAADQAAAIALDSADDEEVGLRDRVLLFLYALTAHPPLY